MEPHADARERVHTALLAVDDTDGRPALQTYLADGANRPRERTAGRHDVLDQADTLSFLERTLDPVRGPVLLGLVSDDHEREARGERCRRGQHDGAENRTREADSIGLVLLHRLREPAAERLEHVGLGLEAELVEVEARPLARTEDEVTLQVPVLDERLCKLLVVHAAARTSRASASRRAPSATSSPSDVSEPSAR